jgi:hypothetical protein
MAKTYLRPVVAWAAPAVEVARPNRWERRLRGKTDLLDAEAARAVPSRRAQGTPKNADGTVELLRQIKMAKDTAVKAQGDAAPDRPRGAARGRGPLDQ